jgi:hypothetical protein
MYAQMRCDFRYQITPAFTHMIAGTQVMYIAKSALDRIGAAAIGRQKNRLKRGSCANHCSTLACAAPAIGPGGYARRRGSSCLARQDFKRRYLLLGQ